VNCTILVSSVPNGFCVTARAYFKFWSQKLKPKIKALLDVIDVDDPHNLIQSLRKLGNWSSNRSSPKLPLKSWTAYKKLCSFAGLKNVPVAVRTSAPPKIVLMPLLRPRRHFSKFWEKATSPLVRACCLVSYLPLSFLSVKNHYDISKLVSLSGSKMVQAKFRHRFYSKSSHQNKKESLSKLFGASENISSKVSSPLFVSRR
jgi:hypothetical protein